jgi:hypothetical protein
MSTMPMMKTMPNPTGIAPLTHSFNPRSSSLAALRPIPLPSRSTDDQLLPLTEAQWKAFIDIFEQWDPIDGFLPGSQCREVFRRSGLSDAVLYKIW